MHASTAARSKCWLRNWKYRWPAMVAACWSPLRDARPPTWSPPCAIATWKRPGLTWCGEADGANPYAGVLAWADRIVCSPDSVNMVSEACATRVAGASCSIRRGSAGGRAGSSTSCSQRGRIRAMDTALASFAGGAVARNRAGRRDRAGTIGLVPQAAYLRGVGAGLARCLALKQEHRGQPALHAIELQALRAHRRVHHRSR